jgi:hypothetical protein
MRRQHQYAGGGNKEQAGANVTTMVSCRENNRQLLYKHTRKGTNTWSEQLDDTLVRWKKDFINVNFKEEKF